MKVLFIVLGILGVLGALAIGGTLFAVHKVREVAATNGIDLNNLAATPSGPARQFDTCQLLTKEDLSQILNLDVERAESDGPSTHSTCRYFSSGVQQRALDEAAGARKKPEEETSAGNAQADQPAAASDVGNMVRGIAGAAAPVVGEANGSFLTIVVDSRNAKAAMAGFKIGMLSAIAMKGANSQGKAMMSEEVKGVGDEAISVPHLKLLMFRQGDVSVQFNSRLCPGGRDAQIAIANRIISKL